MHVDAALANDLLASLAANEATLRELAALAVQSSDELATAIGDDDIDQR